MLPKRWESGKFTQNYRPISMLPVMINIVENIITVRIKQLIEELGVLPDKQFGFRYQYSTEHQIVRLVDYATGGLNRKLTTEAILLDVAKAFDRV